MSDSVEMRDTKLAGRAYRVRAGDPRIDQFWVRASEGGWESETIEWFEKHVKPDTLVLDIGAWIGPIALLCSRLGKAVLAVEPDPVALSHLQPNVAANAPNVTVLPVAVDKTPGTVTLYAKGEFGSSETSTMGAAVGGMTSIVVETRTLASLAEQLGAGPLVIKIDVEGHEYNIADDIIALARDRRAAMNFSMHPRSLYRSVRDERGHFAARQHAYRATMDIINQLRALGKVEVAEAPGWPVSWAVGHRVFLRRNLKNFTLTLDP